MHCVFPLLRMAIFHHAVHDTYKKPRISSFIISFTFTVIITIIVHCFGYNNETSADRTTTHSISMYAREKHRSTRVKIDTW